MSAIMYILVLPYSMQRNGRKGKNEKKRGQECGTEKSLIEIEGEGKSKMR